jgi:hypothetical protein
MILIELAKIGITTYVYPNVAKAKKELLKLRPKKAVEIPPTIPRPKGINQQ